MFKSPGLITAIKLNKFISIITIISLIIIAGLFFLSRHRIIIPAQQQVYRPLAGQIIVIDPGHGGIDSGVHFQEAILEKQINLELAISLKKALQNLGAEALLTREKDEDVSPLVPGSPNTRYQRDMQGRAKFINDSDASFFLSLHVNSCEVPGVRGSIVFYCDRFRESIYLAESVQKSLNRVVPGSPGSPETSDYVHRKIKEGDYYLLKETNIPGVIVEVGFLTNPEERALLTDPSYINQLAEAISQGIIEYIDFLPFFAGEPQKKDFITLYGIYFD